MRVGSTKVSGICGHGSLAEVALATVTSSAALSSRQCLPLSRPGVQLLLGWEIAAGRGSLEKRSEIHTATSPQRSLAMSARALPAAANETREQRIEALMKELRPKIEAEVRKLVERAVDVSEAEEFGAIDFAFRDAGQKMVNEVRQA